MKIKSRIKSIFTGIKSSSKSFPISIILSILLTGLLIYNQEFFLRWPRADLSSLYRIELVVGLGILLYLNIDLLKFSFFRDKNIKTGLSYILGLIFLIVYFIFFLKDINYLSIIRYIGFMIFLFIAFFYIGRLNKREGDYEYYVIDLLSSIGLTIVYSLVLLLGISAILLTINALFDINIPGRFYYYTFLIVFFIFGIPFLLSKIPGEGKDFTRYKYPQSLRILLSYIVIPLISIYTVILYLYFIKILLDWEWPRGLVSHLVLWYSSISVGVIFLIEKIADRDKIANIFKRLFPKLVLPILVMMFISIGQRINQYGITENRYYILALGIWVTGMMGYLSFKKEINTIIIPISLSLIVVNSVIGPISSFAISKYSQNRRLENILKENNMLRGEEIVRNIDISRGDKKEINNIIYYFDDKHSLQDIRVLDDGFKTSEMEEVFGFKHDSFYQEYPLEREYFNLHKDMSNRAINIQGYDYYSNIGPGELNEISIGTIKVNYKENDFSLTIEKDSQILIDIDIQEIAREIVEKSYSEDRDELVDIEDMIYRTENESLRLKFVFSHIYGVINNGEIEISNLEFLLLTGEK